jgi:glycosyltransferase involved in cell wall biosynthesis
MSPPRVSVGIPVFNGERFIGGAIEAILCQDFDDFELIISDNASTDRTGEICLTYQEGDGRVRYSRCSVNIGALPNFNRVFSLARGEFFKWLPCDDRCHPSMLRKCMEMFDRRPESVVLVYPQCEWIDEAGRVQGRMHEDVRTNSRRSHTRLRQVLLNRTSAQALLGIIRSRTLSRTRLRRPIIMDDCVLLAELALHGQFCELQESLMQVRVHPGNSYSSGKRSRELMEWLDPRNAARRILVPARMQMILEELRGIGHGNLSLLDRCLCYLTVFVAHGWRGFSEPVGIQIQRLVRRMRRLVA